jgi:hypothetical protein
MEFGRMVGLLGRIAASAGDFIQVRQSGPVSASGTSDRVPIARATGFWRLESMRGGGLRLPTGKAKNFGGGPKAAGVFARVNRGEADLGQVAVD